MKFKVKVRIEVEQDGDSYYAYCPDLKGVHVDGDTADQARSNAMLAVSAYVQSLVRHDEPIPVGIMPSAGAHVGLGAAESVEEVLVEA
ncbi:type II toxin-antitoxin system HicB family antitoxin [Paraburkholderia bannensis]|uniref:type II toxin-antitoxin system HicB family antitoxin n=1 Tax=Paraburkholderia bannensis TaxID=765414 RepID=UPI000693EC5B|nr:type II toxin-antitoxin system HicB family antitoxin [Paraburkholderia bannensis]